MIEPGEWDDLVKAVADLNGLDLDTANDVVSAVGDTPMLLPSGRYLARIEGRELEIVWPE